MLILNINFYFIFIMGRKLFIFLIIVYWNIRVFDGNVISIYFGNDVDSFLKDWGFFKVKNIFMYMYLSSR